MEKTQTQKTTQVFQLATQFLVFMELADRMQLTGTEKLVYLHLLKLINRTWNHTAVKISDADFINQLNLHTTTNKLIPKTTLSRAKKNLADWGLIVYKAGTSRKKNTVYKLTPLNMDILKNSDFLVENGFADTFADSFGIDFGTVFGTVDPSISARTDAKKKAVKKIFGTVFSTVFTDSFADSFADSSGTVDADKSRTDNNRAHPKTQDPRPKTKEEEEEERALSEKNLGELSGDETALPEDNATPNSYNATQDFPADDTDNQSEELGAPYGAGYERGERGNFDDEDSEDNAAPSYEVLESWKDCTTAGTVDAATKRALANFENDLGQEKLIDAIYDSHDQCSGNFNLKFLRGYIEGEYYKPRPNKEKNDGSYTRYFGKKRTQFSEPIRETEEWADGQDHGEFDD